MLGPLKDAVIAINGQVSAEVDLGSTFEYLQVYIPTIDSSQVGLQVCDAPGGTYKVLGASALTDTTTGDFKDVFTLGGFRYIKVTTSAAQASGAVTFVVRGWRA